VTAIRLASLADLDLIVAFEAGVFADDAWSPRSLEAEFDQVGYSRQILVAESGGDVVGYAVLMFAGGSGDLSRIAVDPSFRRQGIARRLLDEVIDLAHRLELDALLLEVAADNEAALALYAEEGFVEVDRRPRYYADARDAIVMRRSVGADATAERAGDGGEG
jgi:ribosomal-protein-alanine N-acetyltransferase